MTLEPEQQQRPRRRRQGLTEKQIAAKPRRSKRYVEADPEQLTQALVNIVRNAAQALQGISGMREIRLRTRVARGITLAKRRHRLALALSVEVQEIDPEFRIHTSNIRTWMKAREPTA